MGQGLRVFRPRLGQRAGQPEKALRQWSGRLDRMDEPVTQDARADSTEEVRPFDLHREGPCQESFILKFTPKIPRARSASTKRCSDGSSMHGAEAKPSIG